ncbi:MAG TPA: thiamine diphosphokinase [Gaiellaceae bacterium]|jgi:thiamine pyrophosphokinase|nr:thiamine diphosphokinase [Gaiellaceae bacterium]
MPAEEGVVVEGPSVLILAGGEGAPQEPVSRDGHGTVIAADSGLDLAYALGLRVDVAVGDFDSATPAALARAAAEGTAVDRHPADKDATDLELALDRAVALGAGRVLVVGGDGGRLDHLLAGALLLGSARYASLEVDARLGAARAYVVRDERILTGTEGELVSLLALHGPAQGVTTVGLRFPLRGETVSAGSTRGVSNVLEGTEARVTLERGVLLAVFPGEQA